LPLEFTSKVQIKLFGAYVNQENNQHFQSQQVELMLRLASLALEYRGKYLMTCNSYKGLLAGLSRLSSDGVAKATQLT